MNLLRTSIVVMAALGSVSVAQAELIDRGEGFIYDTVLNITWTQNANMDGLLKRLRFIESRLQEVRFNDVAKRVKLVKECNRSKWE